MNPTRQMHSVLLMSFSERSCALSLLTLLCLWTLSGCEIFKTAPDKAIQTDVGLPRISVPSDAMQLEVLFVERPVGDKLLGDELWNEVDTILNLEPEEQRDLVKNGFQIGVAASHPPGALQQLLELRAKPREGELTAPQDVKQRLQGNRCFVRPGCETEIQLNEAPYEEFSFNVFASHNSTSSEVKKYADAKCLYRVTAHRDQPGWVRLEFVPEIHHGLDLLRPQAGAENWELKAQQNVERLFKHRFTVILNTGDMALVTGRPDAVGTMGHRFFTGPAGKDSLQRMLIVRLASAGSSNHPFGSNASSLNQPH